MESSRETIELAARRQKIAAAYLRGQYQSEIASELGVDQATVSRDLKAIRAAWLASAVRDFDAAKAQELAKIDEVERAAWEGWKRSAELKEVENIESDGTLDPQTRKPRVTKVTKRREGQAGSPAFLNTILTCIERRCAILGLDAPKRFVIKWDELSDEQVDRLAAGEAPEKVLSA